MEICTIGFTRRSAESFFEALRSAGVKRLVDVRRHNTSQLAGFSKRDDLAYFLDRLLGVAYEHRPEAAPTAELLSAWRDGHLDWDDYERTFRALLAERRLEETFVREEFDRRTVLLCSEPEPDRCHRRLVVEHLARHWDHVTARHL